MVEQHAVPPPLSPFEVMAHQRMAEAINQASREEDYFDILFRLESVSPLAGAAAECPFFVLMPPSLKNRKEWLEILKDTGLDQQLIQTLTASGFMPFGREHFAKKTRSDIFEGLGTIASHTLVDLDYGILLLPIGPTIGNFSLDRELLERLQAVSPFFVQSPASVLSVGPMRAHYAMQRQNPSIPKVIEFEASSRSELDQILQKISAGCANLPMQLWFRGQSNDYLLADLRKFATVCPWRNIVDSSLVPSLYRQSWNGTSGLREYCSRLHTLHEYVLFMKSQLAMVPYTTRGTVGLPIEKLSDAWGAYTGGPTVTQTNQAGEIVATRDYHPAFLGMQQSFFLQHYGLPSNILDITHDIDVALFFAQNEATSDSVFIPVDYSAKSPLIYIFLLVPGMDRFIDSRTLSEHYRLERPLRQQCGLLCGASYITRNYYARFVGIKIHLKQPIEFKRDLSADYLFPDRSVDPFLDALLRFQQHRGLKDVAPFELNYKHKS
jgi:hypothetical protein